MIHTPVETLGKVLSEKLSGGQRFINLIFSGAFTEGVTDSGQGYRNQIGNQPAKVASVRRLNQSPFTVPFKYVRISLDCEAPLADAQ
ncbi:MAG: hypothetical protein P8X74_06715 [Reinekea sp.]